jgi:hypothetical protein
MKIKPKTGDFFYGKVFPYDEDFIIAGEDRLHFYHDLSKFEVMRAALASLELLVSYDDGYHEGLITERAFLHSDEWEYMGNVYELEVIE